MSLNTLRPRQNGRHFADDIFKCIFFNENVWIPIKISLKFVPKGPINNIPSLVQIMAWRRPGDKPLSEPMMVSLLTHICVTRPQWVNERTCVTKLLIMAQMASCNLRGPLPYSFSRGSWECWSHISRKPSVLASVIIVRGITTQLTTLHVLCPMYNTIIWENSKCLCRWLKNVKCIFVHQHIQTQSYILMALWMTAVTPVH